MSVKASIEKREKSLAELVVVIVLFALLMAIFISYFMKQKDQITYTGFNRLANNFVSKVNAVHGQWYMDNKPSIVKLSLIGSLDKEFIPVNKKGWLDVKDDQLACQKIWQLALDTPMEFLKSPVSAVEIKKTRQKVSRICRYSISSTTYFEYNTLTGQITN
ncbi:MAG: syndecan [Colwellia sp.]|nr:syndecan [Colwellia sp.]